MTNNLTKILRSGSAILAFSCLISTSVSAQTCATPPSCEELGYVYSSSDCTDGLSCPFNLSQKWCKDGCRAGTTFDTQQMKCVCNIPMPDFDATKFVETNKGVKLTGSTLEEGECVLAVKTCDAGLEFDPAGPGCNFAGSYCHKRMPVFDARKYVITNKGTRPTNVLFFAPDECIKKVLTCGNGLVFDKNCMCCNFPSEP